MRRNGFFVHDLTSPISPKVTTISPPTHQEIAAEAFARCQELGLATDSSKGLTRLFLTPAMKRAHDMLRVWMKDAGLIVRVDDVGNMIGRRAAADRNAPIFIIASHIDSVPNGGLYDGPLGVMLGVATAKALREEPLPFHLDVIAFSEEEGVRYRAPFIGSKAIAGCLDVALLDRIDSAGVSMRQAIDCYGLNASAIPRCVYQHEKIMGYLEAHIEQGPVLQRLGQPVGVVTTIAGQRRWRVVFDGRAAHAGTTPMSMRQDALVGAAALISFVNGYAKSQPGLVATVGSLHVQPGAINVVPDRVELTLEFRHAEGDVLETTANEFREAARHIAAAHKLEHTISTLSEAEQVPMNPALTEMLAAVAGENVPQLVSGAGHDAMIMASVCPVTMLFVRCKDGISHHPDESVEVEDVAAALTVMVNFLRTYSASAIGGVTIRADQ
ncbi:allantoate amidohydrolase [soil metagenome]